MITPIIHLNGDRAEVLRDGYLEAYRALTDAMDKISCTQPNARNYYCHPEGMAAFDKAVEEHRNRIRALQPIAEELLALAEHCANFAKD